MPTRRGGPLPDAETLPRFCDYICRHASFAPPEASGACNREQAVYCTLLRHYNRKNAPCAARAGGKSGGGEERRPGRRTA